MDNVGHAPHRGYFEKLPSGTTVSQGGYREGSDYVYPDRDHSGSGPSLPRSGRQVVMRLVRNDSGIALLPGRVVRWKTGYHGRRVDGYTTVSNARAAGVVDEALPSSGVPDDALFLIARKGPALVLTDAANGANNVIGEGAVLLALTAATSQALTSGRVLAHAGTFTVTAVTNGTLNDQVFNRLGRALSAVTTSNTQVLADLDIDL